MTKNSTQTWKRIVDGALVALARHGQHRFTMTDVCAESGISRGTLYRYFASKDDILAGIEERLETSLRECLTDAIAAQPEPSDRVRVVAAAVARHREEFPALQLLGRSEPGLVLARLAARFDELAALLQECLHPALAEAVQVKRGDISEEQVARIVLHCGISLAALPDRTAEMVDDLTAALEGVLGLRTAATAARTRQAS